MTPARDAIATEPLRGDELPAVAADLPGPGSRALVDLLAKYECPAITARRARRAIALGKADDDPIVWGEARGAVVRDVDGNQLVDLTSAFGVALLGHRHPAIVAAAHAQVDTLLHAMGDAWPDRQRVLLLRALAAWAPPGLEIAILGLSGSDSVDAAVKTALLATKRSGVLAFDGGYHGLSLGTVGLQAYKPSFTDPFRSIAHPAVTHLPYGCSATAIEAALATGRVGLVLVEPIQGRGGLRLPPDGWLAELRVLTERYGALLAFDEIYTAFGRIGAASAAHHFGVTPDLMCVGKALGGGFPLSACLGTRAAMDAWGASTGEALHTQTFLGHPVGCAAGVATLATLVADNVPARATERGERLTHALAERGYTTRGLGLMRAVPLGDRSFAVCRAMLRRGFLVLPAGMQGEVLALTPPVCLTDTQIDAMADALALADQETP